MQERPTGPVLIRAAQYVRMSTEHQQYSTENQAKVIQEYAAKHGMEIVREYADSGKSGLSLAGRGSLQTLLQDVETGATDFEAILVYDVSRWGRFQDTDESAYYEYLCKRAHIHLHYCAEQFENDGSLPSTVMKSMKRAMAGEYKLLASNCRESHDSKGDKQWRVGRENCGGALRGRHKHPQEAQSIEWHLRRSRSHIKG